MNSKLRIKYYNLCFLFVILLTCFIVVKTGSGTTTGLTLSYGDYHYQSSNRLMSALGKIDWEFHSGNNIVRLECMIMDKENFENFELFEQGYGVSYGGYPASDGELYHDSGLWSVTHRDEYYIVVKHDDVSSMEYSTFATINAEFIGGHISVFLLVVLIAVTLAISGLVISLVIRTNKRGKKEISSKQPIDNSSFEKKSMVKDESTESPKNIFCWNCGTVNDSINITCTNCGELLKPKN